MSDSIDLDEITVEEEDDEQPGNYGDWLWRDDGSAPDAAVESPPERDGPPDADGRTAAGSDPDPPDDPAAPGVPSVSDGPVGVPGNPGGPGDGGTHDGDPTGDGPTGAGTAETHDATDPDDMTMAITYKAAHHFSDPGAVFASAREWSDWLGIVGEVSTPAIRKFQRDNRIDLDFFGGSGGGPAARLADVDRESMFYADRMVLVGTDADEWIADEAGWEFVPLERAAEKAGWTLREDL